MIRNISESDAVEELADIENGGWFELARSFI